MKWRLLWVGIIIVCFGFALFFGMRVYFFSPKPHFPQRVSLRSQSLILSPPISQTQDITQYNERLLNLAQRYFDTPSHRSQLLLDMRDVQDQRDRALQNLLSSVPDGIFGVLFSQSELNLLPEEIRDRLETYVTVQGTFELVHADDFEQNISSDTYTLRTDETRYTLLSNLSLPAYPPNATIQATGIEVGTFLIIDDAYQGTLSVLTSESQPTVSGTFSTAVVLLNFINDTREPITSEQAYEMVVSGSESVDAYYRETSFGNVSFTGQVFPPPGDPWITIDEEAPSDSSECVYDYYATLASVKVHDLYGVWVASSFSRVMYIWPNNACPFSGLAMKPGYKSIYNGVDYPSSVGTFVHELGHNFGMWHANALTCTDRAIGDSFQCTEIEYGDYFDAMGGGFMKQYNGPHKTHAGWFSPSQMRDVTESGQYVISLAELTGNSVKLLRIPRPLNQTWGNAIYLSYRQPVGFDQTISGDATKGVSVHLWSGGGQTTKFIDPNPSSVYREALSDLSSVYDQLNGIFIRQLSHDEDSVTVAIELNVTVTPTPIFSPTPIPSPTGFCTDTDGGLNIWQKGTACDATRCLTDWCTGEQPNKKGLAETKCNGTSASTVFYPCPTGFSCTDGRCSIRRK